MKKILTILFLLLPLSLMATEHKIAASVDDNPITFTDINNRSKLIINSSDLPDNQKSYKMIFNKVLDMLVDEKLIEKEADKLNIKVEDQEIYQAIANIASKNHIPDHEVLNFLKNKNIDEQELKKQIMHQILWSKIISIMIQPTIHVSDKDILNNRNSIHKRIKAASEVTNLHLAEIVLFHQNDKDIDRDKSFAQQLHSEIKLKDNFAQMAKQFSQTPSGANGGDIGWVSSNQISIELASKILRLNTGDIHVAYLPDGVHLLKILDKKIISHNDKSIDDFEIKNYLMDKKLELNIKDYLKRLRLGAHIKYYNS